MLLIVNFCFHFIVSSDADRSSTELASSSHGNASNGSMEKNGFTNVVCFIKIFFN